MIRAGLLAAAVLGFFTLGVPAVFAAAPFSETFDSYENGNLYGQGLWQNKVHSWDVTDSGCKSGKCIVATGSNGANWKSGENLAKGEWHFDFYMNNVSHWDYVGPSIFFGSAEHPLRSDFSIRTDGSNTFKILDNRSNSMASGLALDTWHAFTYRWDMTDPTNCTFTVRIDDGPEVISAPSIGDPSNCYDNIYAEHAIGSIGLSNSNTDRGQLIIDTIGDGPTVDGCMFNCDGTIPPYISDSFDYFNDKGWATIAGQYRVGVFDDGSSGNCHTGGCIRADAGSGGLGGGGFSTYMYLESGVGAPSGAYTIWAKVADGWSRTLANVGICTARWSECGGNYTYWWNDIAPADEAWHQYYLAWRQGTTNVESCLLRDDTDSSHCSWRTTNWPLGTQFDGVVLAGGGSRPDLGDHVWFDELEPVSSAVVCTENCNSNVMFLPGIEASRLYRTVDGQEKKLWEPGSDADAMQLAMNADGTSVHNDIYTRDILDNAYVAGFGNVYKSFIESMDGLVSDGKIAEWEPVPYDWRYSLEQILARGKVLDAAGNISYTAATSSPYITQELKRLASTSRTGKVTLIAHSNGGLVAKALMLALGPDAAQYVDKIILVASPQIGTPVALAALLHGAQQGLPIEAFPYAISPATARSMGDTMPGIYTLLPSASYFTYVDDPVATFDQATIPDWVSTYGDVIHSQARQHAFLADTLGYRTAPNPQYLKDPTILSDSLLTQAENMHQELDAWTPPQGVQVIQIAGWGIPTTIKGINYSRSTLTNNLGIFTSIEPTPQFTVDGDGTVVTPSALWMSTSSTTQNYWFNLGKYSDDHWLITVGGADGKAPFQHANILEVDILQQFIEDMVENNLQLLNNYSYVSTYAPDSPNARLRYILHSPLTFNLYDNQGHHTGISTSTGIIEKQIPGTYYLEFGDVKYVFTNTDIPIRIIMDGYATSTFTFTVEQFNDATIVASTTWKDMPVTPSTIVTLGTQSDITTLSPMRIDSNGDGNTEYTLVPKMDGVVTLPKYTFGGFLQPINDSGINGVYSTSIFKAGSTVPVKFQLRKTDGSVTQAGSAPVWLTPVRGHALDATVNDAATSTAASVGTIYRWDSTNSQYIYNWSTKGFAAGYWYTIYAQLDDGTIYSVKVGLK